MTKEVHHWPPPPPKADRTNATTQTCIVCKNMRQWSNEGARWLYTSLPLLESPMKKSPPYLCELREAPLVARPR